MNTREPLLWAIFIALLVSVVWEVFALLFAITLHWPMWIPVIIGVGVALATFFYVSLLQAAGGESE